MYPSCVVLNGDYSYLNTISWQKALKLMCKNKAVVLKYANTAVKTAEAVTVKIPVVMKLMKIIRAIYRTKVPYSKKNIMVRDGFTCQYCGSADSLTIDHVIPASKAGKTNFENCVTACKSCNNKKGAKFPSEAGMYLRKKPTAPTISEFTRLKAVKTGIFDLLKELGIY